MCIMHSVGIIPWHTYFRCALITQENQNIFLPTKCAKPDQPQKYGEQTDGGDVRSFNALRWAGSVAKETIARIDCHQPPFG
jgi:hypothetical protein